MKQDFRCIARLLISGAAFLFICSSSGRAQSAAAAPGSAPLLPPAGNHQTSDEAPRGFFSRSFKFSGQLRERWEATQGPSFTTLTPAGSYVLSRIRLGVAFRPTSWLRFYGEAQDARAIFYKTSPGNSISNPFDWRQGYVEVGAMEGNGIDVRAGRQELTLGSGRLVTSGEWSNVTKAFDIARGSITYNWLTMDLIGGSILLIDPTRMDRSKPGEHLYADYMSLKRLIPRARVEPYFLTKTALNVKSKEGHLGNADTLYIGGRIFGTLPGGFDYTYEGVIERGDYSTDAVHAWGSVGGGGWTNGRLPWKLHFSSDYMYATGDSGLKDDHHESFDYLYGSQQPTASLTGLFAWRNIENWRSGVDFAPRRGLSFKVDYRNFWLATVNDSLYNAIGTATVLDKKATSNHVGSGIETLVTNRFGEKTSLGIGLGTLSPGAYLKQAGKTGGFFYPSLTLKRDL